METNSSEQKRTRRRRSGGSSKIPTTASSALQHPLVSRVAPMVMAGAAALYVLGSAAMIYQTMGTVGDLWTGLSKTDVRYIVGPATRENGQQWTYDQGETTRTLQFDSRDKVESIQCLTRGANSGACAPYLGIGINRSENEVRTAFGMPDQQQYFGETKVLTYSGLGVKFILERYSVKGIARIPRGDIGQVIAQWLRTMFP